MLSRPLTIGCLAVAATFPSCKKKDKPKADLAPAESAVTEITWVIPDVGVELMTEQGHERDIDATALARRIGSKLRATPYFTGEPGDAGPGRRVEPAELRARITYSVIAEGSLGRPASFVAAEGSLVPGDSRYLTLHDNVATEQPIAEGEARDAALLEQIHRAVDEMVAGLIAKEALRGATPEELGAALAGEPARVQWALAVIADRQLTTLRAPVRALLTSADRVIADAAISAAVALDDTAAVKVLTEGIDFTDHERMRVVIEASAALGGDEARQFLEFVATGHEDDDVKAHAADALERLRR